MKALLFLAMLLPCQNDTKTLKNGHVLVSRDWSDKSRVLSLTQSEKWYEGSAWILASRDDEYACWKGIYNISRSSDNSEDLIFLKLGLTRRYDYTSNDDGEATWKMNSEFDPQGILLEIPLDQGTVPDDVLTTSVVSAFYADRSGKEATRRIAPQGLLQKLTGEGYEITLDDPEMATIGETLRLESGNDQLKSIGFPDLLPPGFKIRQDRPKVSTSTRPASNSAIEELWAQARKSKDPKEVLEITGVLLRLDSSRPDIHRTRGRAHANLNEYQKAVESYSRSIELDKNIYILCDRADIYLKLKKYKDAAADYRAAMELKPESNIVLSRFAWFLATCRDGEVRNGTLAVKYADQLCKQTSFKYSRYVDTLAAAYAEAGDFRRAILWETEALELLKDEKLRDGLTKRLSLFKESKSFVED